MSWKAEVQTGSSTAWSSNGLRFATQVEAVGYALDLALRWTAVKDFRPTEVPDEPATYRWSALKGLEALNPTP